MNNSFNHYSFGVVVEWLYRGLVGINPSEEKPGFREIIFKPNPDFRDYIPNGQERISHAIANVDSPMGLISAEINVNDDKKYTYSIEVPCNSTGIVCLPVDSEDAAVYETNDTSKYCWEGISYLGYDGKCKRYLVGSGKYCFTTEPMCNVLNSNKMDEPKLRIYPNPTYGTVWIDSEDEVSEIIVYSVSGYELLHFNGNIECIDIGSLAKGLYIVKIVTANGQKNIRVIKK